MDLYRNKRVLVTGHTGFKGSWLVQWLLSLGADVYGISLKPQVGSIYDLSPGLEPQKHFEIDLLNRQEIESAISTIQPELVFHLAAKPLVIPSYLEPFETFETNIGGSINLFRALLAIPVCKGVVVITTDKVYKNKESEVPYREDSELFGKDPYSASKVGLELLVNALRSCGEVIGNFKFAVARAGNVVGGGDRAEMRLWTDLQDAFSKQRDLVLRSPDAVRPWQHVLDPLYGYLKLGSLLLEGAEYPDSVNFAPGAEYSSSTVEELVRSAARSWSEWTGKIRIQPAVGYLETKYLNINSELAMETLGWKCHLSPLEAIEWCVRWEKMKSANRNERIQVQISEYLDLI